MALLPLQGALPGSLKTTQTQEWEDRRPRSSCGSSSVLPGCRLRGKRVPWAQKWSIKALVSSQEGAWPNGYHIDICTSGALSKEDTFKKDLGMTRQHLWLGLPGPWAQDQEQLSSVFREARDNANEAPKECASPMGTSVSAPGHRGDLRIGKTRRFQLTHLLRSIPVSFLKRLWFFFLTTKIVHVHYRKYK